MEERQELQYLRLFPLERVVLYPGMELPLVVFEDRYQVLVKECTEENAPFGVVLLRSGQEVGDPEAETHGVGTTARIQKTEQMGSGQIRVTALGERRFRVHSLSHELPYLSAQVEFLSDEEPIGPSEELVQRVRGNANELARAIMAVRGGWIREVSFPSDPATLSYLVAQMLRGRRRLQQRLLEATVSERLEQEAELLERAIPSLRQSAADAWTKRGFSPN